MSTFQFSRSLGWALGLLIAGLCVASPGLAADAVDDSAFDVTADTTLDDLVAPIALYPDDLLAILIPASAYPLDVVQASRFVDKLEANKDLKPDEAWDESVRNLLNTPDVVQLMATHLDWTIRLGEEVADDQAEVMDAIQMFRREVDAAGNLESDDKQKIVAEEDTIRIELSNPEVIYVPQYNPQIVVVPAPIPPIRYYPTPYPVYYYPYPPGARFATGFFFGATTAFAFSWRAHSIHHGVHGYHGRGYHGGGRGYRGGHNDVNINRNVDRSRNTNINVNNKNVNKNNRNKGGGGSEWKPKNKGGQRTGSKIAKPTNRAGGAGYKPRTTGGGNRATTGAARSPSKRVNTGGSYNRTGSSASQNKASNRASSSSNRASSANRASSSSRNRSSSGHRSGSFSGRSSGGHSQSAASARGRSSRSGGGHRGGGGRGGGGGGRRR